METSNIWLSAVKQCEHPRAPEQNDSALAQAP
jgi:hypothetical protein